MNALEPIGRDSIVEYLKELLPVPIWEGEGLDGSMTLVGGDPGEVIVRITADEVFFGLPSSRFDGGRTAYTSGLSSTACLLVLVSYTYPEFDDVTSYLG